MAKLVADRLGDIQEYYFSRKLEEIRRMNANGDNVLNLGIGSPDMPPAPEVVDALKSSASNNDSHAYQSYKGVPSLREAMATYYKTTYDVELDSEKEILPLLGSKEGISHISMAFLNAGDEVLVPNPGYPTYAAVTSLSGASAIHYDLMEEDNWSIDWEELGSMDLSKVKMMWVNYPNMPTGSRGSKSLFEEIVEFGKQNDILICHDNPYSRILNDSPLSILSVEGAKDIAIELNSLSKSHNMAGWRLGWVSGSEENISTILRYKSNIDSGMFLPVQMGGITALGLGANWFETLNTEYETRKTIVWKLLDLLSCVYSEDQSGLFIWAKLPDPSRLLSGAIGSENGSEDFCNAILEKAKVFLAPGTIFGSQGEGYVRVSLCSKVEVLKEAVERIEKITNR